MEEEVPLNLSKNLRYSNKKVITSIERFNISVNVT